MQADNSWPEAAELKQVAQPLIFFALMSAEDIATELSKYGDYKTFPLEQIYRTYDSKRISDIQQVVM